MNFKSLIKRVALLAGVFFAALMYVAYIRLGFAGPIPDLIPLGASPDEILAFRDALGFEGKEVFNNTYRVLDFGLVITLTGLLALIAQDLRPKRGWWFIVAFGLLFAGADVAENYFLAQLINGVPNSRDVILADYVNISTRIKFAALLMVGAAWITVWRQEGASS